MKIHPVRNSEGHQQALTRLTALLENDPEPESEEALELEVLTTLIEKYEDEHFQIAPPTPLEAIRFRMDQQGLKNKDLVPYIGSPSRVSEVLRGKRPLSIAMIRNLHQHLGIPAEVLIRDQRETTAADETAPPNASNFPVKDMYQRGYFRSAPATWAAAKKLSQKLLEGLFRDAGVREASPVYCRSTTHYRQAKTMNEAALLAWQARVLVRSKGRTVGKQSAHAVSDELPHRVAALSVFDEGPLLAREFLEKQGIAVVVEPHLPGTYLDGAAFLRHDGVPVVGLTLRHDRLDNFWFTLLHELKHVSSHLTPTRTSIFDDLAAGAADSIEREADSAAAEALIPEAYWRSAAVRESRTAKDAEEFARKIQRHPAVVVGRLQKEAGNYRLLARSPGVGRGRVRRLFAEFQA